MKKSVFLSAAVLVAVALSGCGGGGSDSVAVTTPPVTTPPPPSASVACPDGTSAATAAQCAAVTATVSIAAAASVDPAVLNKGLTVQFTGAIKPASGSLGLTQGGAVLPSTVTVNAANTVVTLVPSFRAGFGQQMELTGDVNDALGRPIHVGVKFSTGARSCSNNALWSNPATFSATVGDCVAPKGVQATVDSMGVNKMQDSSCTFAVLAPLAVECQKYVKNATIVFSDTDNPVQDHPSVVWGIVYGSFGNGIGVLFDKTTMSVISRVVLPPNVEWIIGNPTGAAIRYDGATHQMSYAVVGSVASITVK